MATLSLRIALAAFLVLVVVPAPEAARRPRWAGPALVDGQVLVGFHPGAAASARADAHRQAGGQVLRNLDRIGVQLVSVGVGGAGPAVAAYRRNPNVRFAEPNHVRILILPDEGQDPPFPLGLGIDYLAEQWGINNTGQGLYYDPLTLQTGVIHGTPDADIDAPAAWDLTQGDPAVRIAILDAGVDCQHVDVAPKCHEQILVTDQSATPTDVIGHGTHVAAIAAAQTNNGKGVAGVGWASRFGSLKVCYEYSDPFFGLVGLCDTAASAEAMIYAADQGYKVINMSYGGPDFSQTEADAAAYAWNHGVVLVAAAGNGYAPTPSYPAAYPHVIAVAASDWHDNLTGFSNFGKTWVSLLAPGHNVFSALPNALCGIPANDPAGCYGWLSGTSMASPHVAGAAALVWARLGLDATPQQVRSALETGADTTGASGQNFLAWTQHGRLNVHAAVAGAAPPPPPPAASVHVGDLDGLAINEAARWTAQVTITVHNVADAPMAGITVAATWSGGASGAASCVTGGSGTCQVSKQMKKSAANATLTITGLTGATYTPGSNHDPDGGSTGTVITVLKP